MKIKLRPISYIAITALFLIGVVVGVQWHRLYLFPFPQLHSWRNPDAKNAPLSTKAVITKYTAETPLFLDRLYFDSIGDERLEGLFLVQIPRHHADNITIKTYKPVTVYRFISDDNRNTHFDAWTPSDIPINVRGRSTKHTRVVTKDFQAGTYTLPPGGPVASSPILIQVPNHADQPLDFEVLD